MYLNSYIFESIKYLNTSLIPVFKYKQYFKYSANTGRHHFRLSHYQQEDTINSNVTHKFNKTPFYNHNAFSEISVF